MAISIRRVGPGFAGEVEGIDIRRPLGDADAQAIHAAMDEYAVLAFREQPLTADQQLAFTRSLGPLEHSIGTSLRTPDEYRLPTTFADVSNLDIDDKPLAFRQLVQDHAGEIFAAARDPHHLDGRQYRIRPYGGRP